MPTLLGRRKRSQVADQDSQPKITPEPESEPQKPRDVFLLVPSDGGLSFRLFTFTGPQAAAAHLAGLGLRPDSKPGYVAFRALNPHVPPQITGDPPEAVVLIQDPGRPGIVDLYSFVDMESANAFVAQETERSLDPSQILVYWAAPVDLVLPDDDAHTEEHEVSVVPGITVPLPPRPNGAAPAAPKASVTPTTVEPPSAPAPAAAPAQAPAPRRRQPVKAAQDARMRVPVTSTGAVFEPEPAAGAAPANATGTARLLANIQAWGGWDGLGPLLIKSALTNQTTFEEFERDPFADGRSRLIVALAAVAAAFGALNSGMTSVMAHLPLFALGWGAFLYTVYAVGTQAFPGHRDQHTFKRLARGLALATAPALLLVLGAVPTYGPLFVLGAYIWVLLTTTTAIAMPLELNRDMSLIVATIGCLALFTVSQVVPLVLL